MQTDQIVDKRSNIDKLTDELMGTLSDDNKALLTEWADENPSNKKLQELLWQIEVSPEVSAMGEEMRDAILQNLNRRIGKTSRRSMWLMVTTVAASLTLLVSITNYISYQQGYRRLNSQQVEMVNPLGMQSSITLSDGTKVILNAGTTLTYPTAFTGKNREVSVSGEAYFEVVHDDEQPFIVVADNINVRVLGTKFNVKAYEEEKNIEITLEKGSVEVGMSNQEKYIKIPPGQQILFNRSEQKFFRKQVELNYYISWKDGMFYFNSMTFEDIARQLERRFNVHIDIASEQLKQIVYTGDFVRQENLEQILRVITADKRTYYKIEGNQVQIYNNI
jgi:ferric-dicitrate binding protein FerR (iron transport regulator)